MKITIDDKQCAKHKLSLQETFLLMAMLCPGKLKDAINNLKSRGVLLAGEEFHIEASWADIIQDLMTNGTNDEDRLLNLAKKMRECYPEGKMPGTAYHYRCNNREVALKMKKFFTQYGKYSDDDIIDAVKRFVAAFNGNYRFLPLLKYFVSKNKLIKDEDGTQHVVEVSPLASFLENKEDVPDVNSDDWLMAARN